MGGGGVEHPRAVEVDRSAEVVGGPGRLRDPLGRDCGPALAVVGVFEREQASAGPVEVLRDVFGPHLFGGDDTAVVALDCADLEVRQLGHPAEFPFDDVALAFGEHLLAAVGVGSDGDLVAHRAGRHVQRRLLPDDLGGPGFEFVDGGVLPIHVVAHFGVAGGLAHAVVGFRHSVAAEIDHTPGCVSGGKAVANRFRKRFARSFLTSGMDPRIEEHAEVIADHSTDIQEGDNVIISAPAVAEDLAVALHEVLAERGANPLFVNADARAKRAFLRSSGEFDTPSHERALVEETDVHIGVRADENVAETSDVDPETTAAYSLAQQPIREERLSKRWCLTQFPAHANAQLAGMSTEAYEGFVWEAINKDWDEQREHQKQLVEILDPADEVRIVSSEDTDLTMRIGGNHAINDYGENNLPGGEVFTAPVPDSVEGTVLFDKPLYHQGREITDVYLEFEGGEVVEHSAAQNEDLLTEVLDTDEGARRLGELGIGMNRDIDRFTYNMLFDEKMGDTVHMAVGMAYDECVGKENEANDSAVHIDMIVDMTENSRIEVDGETVQRDGTFVFESGFEA